MFVCMHACLYLVAFGTTEEARLQPHSDWALWKENNKKSSKILTRLSTKLSFTATQIRERPIYLWTSKMWY